MPSEALAAALGRIARVVARSPDLGEVFAEVAGAASALLPPGSLTVGRVEADGSIALRSFGGAVEGPPARLRPEEFSPALRPPEEAPLRVGDLGAASDPSFPFDRRLAAEGARSLLAVPLRRGDHRVGFLAAASAREGAFAPGHEADLAALGELVTLALEHERLSGLDAARRRRLDALDAHLLTLSPTLALREVFHRVSGAARPVLPHDRLMLTTLSADRRVFTVDALSGEPVPDLPTSNPAGACADHAGDFAPEIVSDIEAEPDEDTSCRRLARLLSVRSALRIPMRLEDGRLGSLFFLSGTPGLYSEEDVVVARRVADHVSLAVSQRRLVEEESRAQEVGRRAALLEERVAALRDELASSRGFRRVVGESARWSEVLRNAARVAPTETTVLLTGESGTGKEVVARFIHRGSPRASGPFVALNCAALPENLLESELFGHEKGAFTGAAAARAGAVEQAEGGVLFLDEVGEMSRPVQAKFLRVLQEREFQRLGATRPQRAEVRVVAATNRDLAAAIRRGEFREDLYYRLQVFEIALPPLRERPDDILPLAESFLEEIGQVVGRPAAGISREAREVLLSYAWPGNVRELRNVLERATILCDGGLVAAAHLPRELARRETAAPSGAAAAPAAGFNLEAAEKDLILRALEASGNNRSQAARLLGLARPQLYTRLRRHGLADERARTGA
jgi:transcriptional regulator with GAF, ATPase, and Fis domain